LPLSSNKDKPTPFSHSTISAENVETMQITCLAFGK
jgi:hypothetical protein